MALKSPIIINDWKKGMKLSALEGFSQMRGIDPFKQPGVASIERSATAITANTTAVSVVNWTVVGPDGTVYFLDSAGKLFSTSIGGTTYSIISGNTLTDTHGNGLAYFKGHIIVVRDQSIDAYKLSNSTWYTLDETLTTLRTGFNPCFVGQDDRLYIGNGQRVARIEITGTFDANNSATYDIVQSALLLPEDYYTTCFGELGDKLYVGTVFGTDSSNPSKVADIFPWSRDSTESFSLPIRIGDEGINSMATSNNLLYVSAGIAGNVYVTNGSSFQPYAQVPLDPKEESASTITRFSVRPDAFDFYGDELLVGITQFSSYLSAPTHNPIGVYSFYKGASRFLGNGSYNKDGSDGTLIRISSVYSVSPTMFYVCWHSGSTTGIDFYGAVGGVVPNKIGSYGAYMFSALYLTGTGQTNNSIENFNVFFKKPLISGDGIRLSYRRTDSGSWTAIKTIDFTTHGGISNYSFNFSIPDIKMVQFKIEMTATSTTTPELIAIYAQ